jgi:hypothetical protein
MCTDAAKRFFIRTASPWLAASCSFALVLGASSLTMGQTPEDSVIYLDQGWSQADREMYYQTSQGSAALSYDIYLNLEVAGSQELFRSDANSERLGMTIQSANPRSEAAFDFPILLQRMSPEVALFRHDVRACRCPFIGGIAENICSQLVFRILTQRGRSTLGCLP